MAQRIAVSAGAIILREIEGELKIALAQHQRSTKTWVIPKGHVEAGETLEQAALREIYEETGLDQLHLIKYLGSIVRESGKGNGGAMRKTIHYYLAYASGNHAHAPTDTRFAPPGWFSPEQALALLPYEEERAFFKQELAPLFSIS
jgi:8-oxo-dGTP pyrophosphatase MutT (NUDIX family)